MGNIEAMVGIVPELAKPNNRPKPEKPSGIPKIPKIPKEQEWMIRRKMPRMPSDGKK